MTMKHIPVLLDAVLNALGDISGKTIVDCTFGAGGYSRAFLARGANVIAFDRDPNVVADADKMRAEYGDKFTFVPKAFSNIADLEYCANLRCIASDSAIHKYKCLYIFNVLFHYALSQETG